MVEFRYYECTWPVLGAARSDAIENVEAMSFLRAVHTSRDAVRRDKVELKKLKLSSRVASDIPGMINDWAVSNHMTRRVEQKHKTTRDKTTKCRLQWGHKVSRDKIRCRAAPRALRTGLNMGQLRGQGVMRGNPIYEFIQYDQGHYIVGTFQYAKLPVYFHTSILSI